MALYHGGSAKGFKLPNRSFACALGGDIYAILCLSRMLGWLLLLIGRLSQVDPNECLRYIYARGTDADR